MSIVDPGRLRGLSTAEKKQITVLRQLIEIIGVQIATKSCALRSVFTNLRLKVKELHTTPLTATNNVSSRSSNSIVGDSGTADHISDQLDNYHDTTTYPSNAAENGEESCTSVAKDQTFFSTGSTESIFAITEKDVENLINLINDAEKQIRTNSEDALFEEDFLHPIAHACLTMWNTVEGFQTPPMVTLTDEEKALRKKRFDEAAAKKKEAAEVARKLQQIKEEEDIKKAALNKALRHNQAHHSIEDTLVPNVKPLGFVDYQFLPNESAAVFFGKVVEVWSVIVSLPKVFQLSKYSLSMFMSTMSSETQQHIIEETCKSLISVGIKGSPLVRESPVNIRGMGWFEQVKEFIMVTSGRKQQRKMEAMRQAAAKKKALLKINNTEEGDKTSGAKRPRDEDSEEEHNSSSSDENYESDEEREEAVDNDEQDEGNSQEDMKELLEDFETYKSRSTWLNMNLKNRLIIMKYLVDAVATAPVVVAAGDSALSDHLAEEAAYSKEIKEIKDGADKELKRLLSKQHVGKRSLESNKVNNTGNQIEQDAAEGSDTKETLTPEQQKGAIEEKLKGDLEAAKLKRISKMEDKCGNCIIFPVGEDRYRRLYWRFPMDSNVYVETVKESAAFPVHKKAKPVINIGDDEMSNSGAEIAPSTDTDDITVNQRIWGKITVADLPVFLSSLETRGTREAALKKELELLVNHLYTLIPSETARVTRNRAITGGYINEFYSTVDSKF
eukprot:Tbor_TRINITY_DN5258_c0_g1::TRINITY_DN5258_c0_g1_i1::g.16654::m.16654